MGTIIPSLSFAHRSSKAFFLAVGSVFASAAANFRIKAS